jgi:acyl-coenzyme A thioesterase PaaI-like protein
MVILPTYSGSFFCDLNREDGLKLTMMYEDGLVWCDLSAATRFEGYSGVLHGGMVFGILDVIIWYIIFMETKKICMTRHIEMDFLKPVMCNAPYVAKGRLVKVRGKDFHASAWVENAKGECCAKVDAIFREGKNITAEDFLERMDFSRTSPETKEFFLSLKQQQVEFPASKQKQPA